MSLTVKRVYDPPSPKDGYRVLVDRLWPRGLKKDAAALDLWVKEVGPSRELRQWFGHEPTRWEGFRHRYAGELDAAPDTGCGLKLFEREVFLRLPYFDHMHRYLPALMQRAGWKTVSVPVNHRHRSAGVSKYNNLNRALVGISDLRGVAWLIKRGKVAPTEEMP